MNRCIALFLLLFSLETPAGAESAAPEICTDDWNRYVDERIVSGDGQGHGPDLGSDEWKGVVEFRLGIRGQPGLPARDSEDWCRYIDRLVAERY